MRARGKYVPLCDTMEKAVQKAIDSMATTTNLMMAKQTTEWFILEMIFSDNKALHFFQERELFRMEEGWHFYGDLHLSEAESFEWIKHDLPALGMMTWACKALKSKQCSLRGNCKGCGHTFEPVWTSMGNDPFCCHCWHSFLMEIALEGIYDHEDEDKQSSGEDEQMEA